MQISGLKEITRIINKGHYRVMPLVGKTPVKIRLENGGMIEIPYEESVLKDFVSKTNFFERLVRMFEQRYHMAMIVSVLAVIACGLIYSHGLSLLVGIVHPMVPYKLKDTVGNHVWSILENSSMQASGLGAANTVKLKRLMDEIFDPADLPHGVQIFARSMKMPGSSADDEVPNAFALLPKSIVVTDGLSKKLSDVEVQAVIAHELGHLKYDHGTQNLIRSSALSLASLALFGADPGIFNTIALSLFEAQYSQEQETQADQYGAVLLKRKKKDPMDLARALQKIDSGSESQFQKYLSTHPLTSERAARIQESAKD